MVTLKLNEGSLNLSGDDHVQSSALSAAMGLKHTVHQIPEVRARAAARGPARSSQPGHIEFGTGKWSV